MCNNCNQNNCTDCTQEVHICNQCQPTEPCDCPILDFSTDCSTFKGDDIECDSIVVVAKNTILSDALANIVSWSCTKFSGIEKFFRIINTGNGAEIYSGANLLGEKKLRKLKSTSPVITVIQNTDDISLGVDSTSLDSFIEANQKTYSISNLGTGAQVYKDSTIVSNNTQFNIRKIKSSNSSVNIVEGVDEIDITVVAGIVPDGSETKVTAGTNTSVTGTGTIATPYVINSTAPDQTVVLTQGGATTITGTYPNFTITSTDSNTTYTAGTGLALTGTVFSVDNLQKIITYPTDFAGTNYTITNSDYNHVIFINNGTVDVSITLDASINIPNFSVGFIQEGSGTVTHLVSGVSLINTTGYKIKGIGSQTFIEKKLNTNIYYLLGNTKS